MTETANVRVPDWLRQSWWVDGGASWGARLGEDHPDRAFVLALIVLVALAVGACIQAAVFWRGAVSALAFSAGAAIAATAFVAQRRHVGTPSERTRSVLGANTLIGSIFGVAFVLGFGAHNPTTALSALLAGSDGYLVTLFATLTPVSFAVRRRRRQGE